MNIVLWILQIVLAAFFLMAGLTKVAQPKEKLRPKMGWVDDYSAGNIKLIATSEILGAAGLILPWLLKIAKVLTPIAAVLLAVVMIGAVVTHAKRKEPYVMQIVITVVCLVVAVGRFMDL